MSAWTGVRFDTCGYGGRFQRTMVTRRLAAGRAVGNWLARDLSAFDAPHRAQKREYDPAGED